MCPLVDRGMDFPCDQREWRMSPKIFAAVVGALLAVVGVILLSTSTSATSPLNGWDLDCGSVFSSNVDQVRHDANVNELADAMSGLPSQGQSMSGVQACEDALGTRGLIGWLVGGFGLLVLAGAVVIRANGQRSPTEPGS